MAVGLTAVLLACYVGGMESPEELAVPARRAKVLSLREAVAQYVPAQVPSLVVGGMHLHNMPMSLVREMVRTRAGREIGLLLAGPAQGKAADPPIGGIGRGAGRG